MDGMELPVKIESVRIIAVVQIREFASMENAFVKKDSPELIVL